VIESILHFHLKLKGIWLTSQMYLTIRYLSSDFDLTRRILKKTCGLTTKRFNDIELGSMSFSKNELEAVTYYQYI